MQLRYKINDRWMEFTADFEFPGEVLFHIYSSDDSVTLFWTQFALSECLAPAKKSQGGEASVFKVRIKVNNLSI